MTGWELPESVTVGGVEYGVNADFRDILDIISRLQDEEKLPFIRFNTALALFYRDYHAIPPAQQKDAILEMMRFLNCGEDEDKAEKAPPRLIDWEQDRQMIVSDINKAAGCEIRALPFLHWWTFIGWFRGIGDGQLSTVVSIRDKLRRGKRLEKWERDYYTENKSRVQLRKKYTAAEIAEQERLKKILGE